MPAGKQCVLFLTHKWSPELAMHYARLKAEAGAVLDVFLIFQTNDPNLPRRLAVGPDYVLTDDDIAAQFPHRFHQYAPNWHFPALDMAWMTVFLSAKFAAYAHCWVVEYDVDFSGSWSRFFAPATGYEGDLLGTSIRPLSELPRWPNRKDFSQPTSTATAPIVGFFPILRASRDFIETYRREVSDPEWNGHFEVLLPSVAVACGFWVAEIGGHGPFTPPERRGLHYLSPEQSSGARATFCFRPARSLHYFVQSRRGFSHPDFLYHPIKTGMPFTERFASRWHRFGQYWAEARNRLLRRG
jgi:hypothetical protein